MGFADVTTKRFPTSIGPAPRSSLRRLLAAVVILPLALGAAGCGRRGALEAPNAPTKTSAVGPSSTRPLPSTVGTGGEPASDQAAVAAGDELSPSAVAVGGSSAPVETSRGAKRGYTIPKQSFILDPLL